MIGPGVSGRTGITGVNLKYLTMMATTALLLAGSVVHGEVLVEDAYVRAMPPGSPNTAAFLTLVNTGTEAVVIDGGQSDAAERVEIHGHFHSDGMMSMRAVPEISVPAGGEMQLQPGGYHLMLIGTLRPLKPGDRVKLVLTSGNATVVEAELPVQSVMKQHQH